MKYAEVNNSDMDCKKYEVEYERKLSFNNHIQMNNASFEDK